MAQIKECPKCKTTPFKYDVVKIYKEKIEKEVKRRVRCRTCSREMLLPYIKNGGKKKI